MHRPTWLPDHGVFLLIVGIAAASPGAARTALADPIRVSGQITIDSDGGDFPDFSGPINGLVYSMGGPGLPLARGETIETIPEQAATRNAGSMIAVGGQHQK